MAKTKPLIVIVEDEKELAAMIADQLEASGMATQMFHRIQHAARFLSKNFANLVLLDLNLPDGTGVRPDCGAAKGQRVGADDFPHRQQRRVHQSERVGLGRR